MAGVNRTLCWLTFQCVPLHAKDALVVQILKSIAADMVTMVLIEIPLVKGIAWMQDSLAVPNPITIGYDNKDPNKEKLKKLMQESRKIGISYRRNNIHRRYSRSIVTISPHYDGHYWRIYGQKRINGRQHARSYYRCAYKERNCSASKTIQQQDPDGTLNNDEETAKYNVVYYGHHSCMLDDNSGSGATKEARSDLIPSGQMAGGATYFQEFDHGDLDVPALLQVLDDSQLDWDILC
ncbi:hypothetical protein ACQ4PT_015427 [Festuca glaucescens]